MPFHYCIGNPCWICYPEKNPTNNTEPKYQETFKKITENHLIPENDLSGRLKEYLVDIFNMGLNEGAHYFCDDGMLTISDIEKEQSKLNKSDVGYLFLEKLLDRMRNDPQIFEKKSPELEQNNEK